MKTSNLFITWIALMAITLIVGVSFIVQGAHQAGASTLAYAVPHVATSSTVVVGPGFATLFATSSNCTGRAVSTVASPIMLSFTGNVIPSGAVGHIQAASTTVFYNNGDYGCGAVTAYGFASSTITITQFVQ